MTDQPKSIKLTVAEQVVLELLIQDIVRAMEVNGEISYKNFNVSDSFTVRDIYHKLLRARK